MGTEAKPQGNWVISALMVNDKSAVYYVDFSQSPAATKDGPPRKGFLRCFVNKEKGDIEKVIDTTKEIGRNNWNNDDVRYKNAGGDEVSAMSTTRDVAALSYNIGSAEKPVIRSKLYFVNNNTLQEASKDGNAELWTIRDLGFKATAHSPVTALISPKNIGCDRVKVFYYKEGTSSQIWVAWNDGNTTGPWATGPVSGNQG